MRRQTGAVVHEIVVVLIGVIAKVIVVMAPHRLLIVRHRLMRIRIVVVIKVGRLLVMQQLILVVRYVHVIIVVRMLKALDFLLVDLLACRLLRRLIDWRLRGRVNGRRSVRCWCRLHRRPRNRALNLIQQ